MPITGPKPPALPGGVIDNYRGSATDTIGHKVNSRITSKGSIHTTAGSGQRPPDRRTQMPSAPLTKTEVHELYASKIAKHLRKFDPRLRTNVPYALGSIEIVTSRRLYHTMIGRETDVIYRTVGRMVVARRLIGPTLGITLVGHFSPSTADLIDALKALDIECVTPETILRMKGDADYP